MTKSKSGMNDKSPNITLQMLISQSTSTKLNIETASQFLERTKRSNKSRGDLIRGRIYKLRSESPSTFASFLVKISLTEDNLNPKKC